MRIGRKEAILALVATMIPWVGRRARAQVPIKEGAPTRLVQSPEIADLQKRVAALEARLASEVGFSRDAYGNLRLTGNRDVTIEAGSNLTVRASGNMSVKGGGSADFWGSGTTTIRGSTIALN